MWPCLTLSTVLMNPVMPAADSRWPRLVFTEPSTSGAETIAIAEHLTERVQLDRIAQPGSGAVRLDVVDVRGRQP